jgi:hypothetical protein
VAETADGGRTFHFVSWIVPLDDPYRAVMPSVAKTNDGTIVAALRRRTTDKDISWVDCYASGDNGRTWSFLSRVGETGDHNGNPPALAALKDGRLACVYGERTRVKLYARLSADGGKTWADEMIVRDDFQPDKFGDKDFGYPRLIQNDRGELVAIYYWATRDHPNQFIGVTKWKPISEKSPLPQSSLLAFWPMDDPQYPQATLTDAGPNHFDLTLLNGTLTHGKFGGALAVRANRGHSVYYAAYPGHYKDSGVSGFEWSSAERKSRNIPRQAPGIMVSESDGDGVGESTAIGSRLPRLGQAAEALARLLSGHGRVHKGIHMGEHGQAEEDHSGGIEIVHEPRDRVAGSGNVGAERKKEEPGERDGEK